MSNPLVAAVQEDTFPTVLYEMWLVLEHNPSQYPAISQFYWTASQNLSPNQSKQLHEMIAYYKHLEYNPPSPFSSQVGDSPSPGPLLLAQESRQKRSLDVRLPAARPGDKHAHTIRGTDARLRVHVDSVAHTFGPSGSDAELDVETHSHLSKQKGADSGPTWSRITSTVTLGTKPRNFIQDLARYCEKVDVQQRIHEFTSVKPPSPNTGTLVSLAAEYAHHTENSNISMFWRSVIEVQVALRCESAGQQPHQVWAKKLSGYGDGVFDQKKFETLHGNGRKLCRLVAGGMKIHLYNAVPALKKQVTNMTIAELTQVSLLFRKPDLDPSLLIAMGYILKSLKSMHSAINFKIHTLASASKCASLGISQVVSSMNLEQSDLLFDSIKFRSMVLPERSVERWFELKTCSPTIDCPLGTLSPEPIDEDFQQRLLQLTDGNITFIYCDLDPEEFKNPIPTNQEGRSAWTEKQREKAASCEKINTVEELSDLLKKLPPKGKQENWLYKTIGPEFNDRKSFCVIGAQGELIFMVIRSMPEEYRTKITEVVQACYPNDFVHLEHGRGAMKTKYFCFWNRYAEHGMGAPEEIHPNDLIRSTQEESSIARHRVPFLSKAITDDGGLIFSQLTAGLHDVLGWVSDQVEQHLPERFESLTEVFEDLPDEPLFAPVYPFTKLILNMGSQTEGHVDPTDDGFCVVIPFGKWGGGGLGLYSLGVILELEHGDMTGFASDCIPHFNLTMTGLRGSLVLATDRHIRPWKDSKNHWAHAIH
ncbi:hypothetical protein BJ322DRAFT_1112633 [Thelephora terrestris]|uniref:Uncharacterized protein n=1 Tax=Thelephora terrestris TaxID=56493 RepID=A0A9P6L372_9AGAM|nr:hypothetical protein BJ322DRAFT_1112633 [Thelephora terrestris]